LLLDFIDVIHPVAIRAHLHPPIWPGKLAYLSHIPALIAAERRAAARADLVIVCSDIERSRLRRIGVGGEICVLQNALPMPATPPPRAAEPTLMFIGAFDSVANIDAAERLALRIMPLVRARVPAARLLVAGARSDVLPSRAAAPPGVDYLGFVDDLDALYARSRVVCCTIMIGGGTRNKLIEAAAYARPMVSTRIGAEGLAFVDGEDILLRDTDAGIADACAGLLADDAECDRLGAAARARMQTHYEASAIADGFAGTVRALLARG
jgi:glycosyltransferase involved in cell wall biosynthesis